MTSTAKPGLGSIRRTNPNGKIRTWPLATQIASGAAMTTMAPPRAVVSLTMWALVTPSDERIERSSSASRVCRTSS